MIYNNRMKEIMNNLNNTDELNVNIDLMEFYNILFPKFKELINDLNNVYYLIDDESIYNKIGKELTWMEWDINERRISIEDNSIYKITKLGLIISKVWSNALKDYFPNKEFDIILSIDEGEENCIFLSATLRFYLVREGYHCCSNIENIDQPIIILTT